MRKSGPAMEQEVGQPGPGDPCYFRVRRGHGSPGGKLEGRKGTKIGRGTEIFKIVLYDNRKYQEEISNFSAGDLAAITALQREQTVD